MNKVILYILVLLPKIHSQMNHEGIHNILETCYKDTNFTRVDVDSSSAMMSCAGLTVYQEYEISKFGKLLDKEEWGPGDLSNMPVDEFIKQYGRKDLITLRVFNNIAVVSWQNCVQTIVSYSSKYKTGQGFEVGQTIESVLDKLPPCNLKSLDNGTIELNSLIGTVLLQYRQRKLKYIVIRGVN